MDYDQFMSFAPKDCQPTVFNLNKDYEESKARLAKELGKKVEDLTSSEKDTALMRIGIDPRLDF